ncbi:MAG: haloalkane dehalogenase [Xanthomonadales bacterium]|nr:haloalkane dehalogenase [Xanthomonadales bacterium]
MEYLRTPDTRFENLPDYPFEANYVELEHLRMHYVDEGEGDPILMLHGEPSWSYLYRHMIPICTAAGHRVVAPDLIGFGKSDKPAHVADYSYASHLGWLRGFLDDLELDNITLVCQDWGSLLGLRLVTAQPDRFKAVVIGNGFLPTGDHPVPAVFRIWKAFALFSPVFPIGRIVDIGTRRSLSEAEIAAYDAPFPSARFKAGARAFPKLVPIDPDTDEAQNNREAWKVLESWEKPFLTTFSNGDPIMRGGEKYFQQRVPGATGQPHVILKGGHFLQEDSPQQFAEAINGLLAEQ